MYKDKQGNPIDAKEWARLLEDPDYRVIGQTTVGAENPGAEVEDDLYPIAIPQLPGKPEAAEKVSAALNAVIIACGDGDEGALAAASILFTVALRMVQGLGKTPEEIRALVDAELSRSMGAALRPTRQPLARGRTRRMRWQ